MRLSQGLEPRYWPYHESNLWLGVNEKASERETQRERETDVLCRERAKLSDVYSKSSMSP